MRNAIDNIGELTRQIAAVTTAGGTTTKEYDRIHGRWTTYTEQHRNAQEQLTAAVLGDTAPERIAELNALALAELAPGTDEALVRMAVASAVHRELTKEYAKVAASNYETLRERFNTTADDFAKAASAVHPETDPAKLINADSKTRTAWANAGILALELTAQLAPLAQAAQLAGIPVPNNDALPSLTINADGLHRRRVWEAWETTGRTNQWAAVIDAGATIHAPALDAHQPYRRPAPIELQTIRDGVGYRQIEVDPEDDNHDNHNTRRTVVL